MFSGQQVCLLLEFSFEDFRCWKIVPCGPKGLLHKYHVKNKTPSAVHLVRINTSSTFHQAAAHNAFLGVTDHWLTKLAQGFDVDFSGCTTVMSKVGALVRAVLPSLSDAMIAAILSKRVQTAKDNVFELINHDHMGFIAEILDSSDQKDLKREHENQSTDLATARTVVHYLRTRGLLVDPLSPRTAAETAAAATSASSSSVSGSAASATAVTVPEAKGSAKVAAKSASIAKQEKLRESTTDQRRLSSQWSRLRNP